MKINSNILSLNSQRNLQQTQKALTRALERLSSGSRINRAGDDAAGLAISEGLKSQILGTGRAIQNLNESYGFLVTADGALQTQVEIVQRMRELAIQAANGAIGSTERGYLNTEFQTVLEEYNRITATSNFNGTKLLDGSRSELNVKVGSSNRDVISLNLADSRLRNIFTREQGLGTFQQNIFQSSDADWVKSGDFNGDGITDFLSEKASTVSVSLGQSDGSYSVSQSFSVSGLIGYGQNVGVGDFNGDGNTDFVLGGFSGTQMGLWLGDGAGQFSRTQTFSEEIQEMKVADFNGDGADDLIELSYGDGEIYVRLGQDGGGLGERELIVRSAASFGVDLYTQLLNGLSGIEVGDFSGDGLLDLAMHGEGIIEIFEGDGNGSFNSSLNFAIFDSVGSLVSGDFDGDGASDLAFSGANVASTEILLAANNFSSSGNVDSNNSDLHHAVDVNNDGHLDILTNQGYFLQGDGNGNFVRAGATPLGELEVGDFDRDGIIDLLSSIESSWWSQLTQISPAETLSLRIDTQERASNVLGILSRAVDNLVEERAKIGASLSVLESASRVMRATQENLTNARSGVVDADFAEETAELTKQQILQQAGIGALLQTNIQLQSVLTLIQT